MKYLSQGQESSKKLKLLLELTSITDNMQYGIYDHLVKNFSISLSVMLHDLKPNNLSVAVKDLNKVAEIVKPEPYDRTRYCCNRALERELWPHSITTAHWKAN